jgi:hypothetical protein
MDIAFSFWLDRRVRMTGRCDQLPTIWPEERITNQELLVVVDALSVRRRGPWGHPPDG